MPELPVMRPQLPDEVALRPYLRRLDAARIYSNHGPLHEEFEHRLAAHFARPAGTVCLVANATLGLTLALAARGAVPGTLCVMPAWTFVATAQAAVLAGLVPYFVDVDPETWALDPDAVGDVCRRAPAAVGAVLPVSPFGRALDMAAWTDVQARLGVPIVVDAAASFDTIVPAALPAVVSLHATKVLGIGEGGFVVCEDPEIIRAVRMRANFGFAGSREALAPAFNAKVSEIHAAVGLAALDDWASARRDWLAAVARYRAACGRSRGWRLQPGFGTTWVSSVCVLEGEADSVCRAEQRLHEGGVGARRWWGSGAHRHPSMRTYPRGPLPVTERLAAATLGVPLFRDISDAEVARVSRLLADAHV